jgi:hypothetical protein
MAKRHRPCCRRWRVLTCDDELTLLFYCKPGGGSIPMPQVTGSEGKQCYDDGPPRFLPSGEPSHRETRDRQVGTSSPARARGTVKPCHFSAVLLTLSAAVSSCSARRLPGAAADQPRLESRVAELGASQASANAADGASQAPQDGGTASETAADGALTADDSSAVSQATPTRRQERDTLYPPERRVDVAAWLQQHGAHGALIGQACWEAALGVPPEPGLICFRQLADAEHASLYRIHAGKLERVWDEAVTTSWIRLNPLPSVDGTELVVYDERGCEQAYCEAIAKYDQHAHGHDWVEMVVHTCRARGRHVWMAGRYVRDRADVPPALTRARLKPNTLGECEGLPGFVRRSFALPR